MWINLFLKCRHHANETQPQEWNFTFKAEHVIMFVINRYRPVLTIEFESSESAFFFESLEDLNAAYACIMDGLHGRESQYKGICKVKIEK